VSMTLDASGFIVFPGGFGTFDELFAILALMQTYKIPKAPIVLFGSDFWNQVDELITSLLRDRYHTISPDDLELYIITDDVDVALKYIQNFEQKKEFHA
jgi:predicted Rossmann-fold nucleotide-binding protein